MAFGVLAGVKESPLTLLDYRQNTVNCRFLRFLNLLCVLTLGDINHKVHVEAKKRPAFFRLTQE